MPKLMNLPGLASGVRFGATWSGFWENLTNHWSELSGLAQTTVKTIAACVGVGLVFLIGILVAAKAKRSRRGFLK
ncbi:MAG: hypothetical protein WC509_03380 [Candidatus Izemoplasmatales bacterium]